MKFVDADDAQVHKELEEAFLRDVVSAVMEENPWYLVTLKCGHCFYCMGWHNEGRKYCADCVLDYVSGVRNLDGSLSA